VIDALRLQPTWYYGGPETPGMFAAVIHACMAVATGMCRHVVVYRALNEATAWRTVTDRVSTDAAGVTGPLQWMLPFGAFSGPTWMGHWATRHMHEFGTTREMLASVAVKNHYNGARDPYAHFQNEITVDDVLKSVPVCHPLHLLDCCPQTDGAAAVLLAPAERAAEFTDRPVFVAGFGVATDHPYLHEKDSFTEIKATRLAAQRAYAMAGVGPEQIDSAEVHDCFTITEILDIEDLGFFEKGDGGRASLEGETALTGRIPVNTSGGLLAKGHPIGATGVAQITECWWQLRGEAAERQIETRNGYALQHNAGGRGSGVSVVNILTNRN
jgi:acetyl-CoA C-acetyltransferase